MVGRRTALLDDPSLSVREWTGDSPVRVVVDRMNSLPRTLRLFDGSVPTIVIADLNSEASSETDGVEIVRVDFAESVITQTLKELHSRGLQTLLVEGGRELLQSFIDEGMWDEAYVETSPSVMGGGTPAPILKNAEKVGEKEWFGHKIVEYAPKMP